jgi:adenylylsulfate kinase
MQKADRGEIKQFTGIDSPYEAPEQAELVLEAGELSIAESVNKLLEYLYNIEALHSGYDPVSLKSLRCKSVIFLTKLI